MIPSREGGERRAVLRQHPGGQPLAAPPLLARAVLARGVLRESPMATLVERVSIELKAAMLAKDAARTTALRMIRAAFIELDKEGKGAVTDERAIDALRRLKKQRDDSIQSYEAASRHDLAAVERAEAVVIDSLLPQLADESTTLAWVKAAIAESGAVGPKELGKAMGALMKSHKADVDGGLARALLQRELGG